jgi:hypothetical protein
MEFTSPSDLIILTVRSLVPLARVLTTITGDLWSGTIAETTVMAVIVPHRDWGPSPKS